jgi:hypothetical protein
MEGFKIALFEQEHAGPFPSFRTLPSEECQRWRELLANRLGLPAAGTALEFARDLAARQSDVPEANAMDGLALLPTLQALGITPAPEIFLNWARFEAVDAFATADVARYFDDLWYPATDDLDVFDASARWLLSVRHDGAVSFIS